MFGVALRAEELRGKVAGYYVDKQLNVNKSMEETTEELEKKMKNMLDEYAPMIEEKK